MPQMSVYVTRNQGHQNMMKIELKIYKLRDALQQKNSQKTEQQECTEANRTVYK